MDALDTFTTHGILTRMPESKDDASTLWPMPASTVCKNGHASECRAQQRLGAGFSPHREAAQRRGEDGEGEGGGGQAPDAGLILEDCRQQVQQIAAGCGEGGGASQNRIARAVAVVQRLLRARRHLHALPARDERHCTVRDATCTPCQTANNYRY